MTPRLVCLLLLPLAAAPARAAAPEEVFARAAPSIVVVAAVDAHNKVTGFGSGVVIGPGRVATNCHVARKVGNLRVRHEKQIHLARLVLADKSRDLCELSAPTLKAPAVTRAPLADVKVGQRVYSVGAPRGLELTLSEGLVSGLRDIKGERYIQTSAPISPGSSGGGLFDADGRLIGITTFYLDRGQNLNFALPADWIGELPQRAAAGWELEPGAAERRRSQAQALQRTHDWPGLLEHARDWVRRESADAEGWYYLGVAHGNLNQREQSITAFREAARLKPDDARSWHNLGVMYARGREHDKAVAALRESLRLRPNAGATWYALGASYHAQGNRDKAREVYEKLRQIDATRAEKFFNAYILP